MATSDDIALALTLGAGCALAYCFMFKGPGKPTAPPPAAPVSPPESAAGSAVVSAPPAAPCQLRLTASGLTADGGSVDIPTAVARCETARRADVLISADAPMAVVGALIHAFARAGVTVTPRRNGRAAPRRTKPRLEDAHTVDLASFAATVSAIAKTALADPTPDGRARGRFGLSKVFIAAIRRGLNRSVEYGHLSRPRVDTLLAESKREGLIEVARADLVAAMDPAEVSDSEIQIDNGTFHFVISEVHAPTVHRLFILRTYPRGERTPIDRWFRAEPPVSWTTARDRLIAAGQISRAQYRLIADPDYQDDPDEPLP